MLRLRGSSPTYQTETTLPEQLGRNLEFFKVRYYVSFLFFHLRVTSFQDHTRHQYADDTQLYCSISTSEFTSEVTRLQDCVRDVSDWSLTNCMQLNGDKSEVVPIALGAQATKVEPKATVDIAGSTMELSAEIR